MISIIIITVIVVLWFCLPWVPALREWHKKVDARPLTVVKDYDVDVHRFASVFHQFVETRLAEALQACRQTRSPQSGVLEDGTAYSVLPPGMAPALATTEREQQITHTLFVSRGDLDLPGGMSYLAEMLAQGSVAGGEGDIYRAVRAQGDINVARNSMVLRWMHADGEVRVAGGSVLHGRISAGRRIHLETGSHFERLYAPHILFGDAVTTLDLPTGQKAITARELDRRVDVAGRRWLFETDLVVPDGCVIDADIVVTGKLVIGSGALITGSIKSHQAMVIGEHTRIEGSAISGSDMKLGQGVRVRGPLVSEGKTEIAPGCVIGSIDRQTTLSAEAVTVAAGAVAHGTVWARQDGEVRAATGVPGS